MTVLPLINQVINPLTRYEKTLNSKYTMRSNQISGKNFRKTTYNVPLLFDGNAELIMVIIVPN